MEWWILFGAIAIPMLIIVFLVAMFRKDKKMLLDDKQIKEICKMGQVDCCRYLTCGGKGFECVKLTSLKGYLDTRVANNDIRAKGDNCKGIL